MSREAFFAEDMKSLEYVIETYKRTDEDRLKAITRLDVYSKMLAEVSKRGLAKETNNEEMSDDNE